MLVMERSNHQYAAGNQPGIFQHRRTATTSSNHNSNSNSSSNNGNGYAIAADEYHRSNYNGVSIRPPSSTSPSILDSPTLARVERAHRRNENEEQLGSSLFHNTLSSYCPSLISVDPSREMHAIKKGLLWQQRERLFARWKERYFILTRDYLHCFKRSSGSEKISNMGQFIFKVKLVEVEKVEWINKKSYSTVALILQDRDYRILLRTNDGLEDWFELLEECTMTSKERRRALHKFGNSSLAWSSAADTPSDRLSKPSNIDTWLLSRTNPASIVLEQSNLSDSVPDLEQQSHQRFRDEHLWRRKSPISYQQRLSLLTDIDINNCDSSIGTPSIQSSTRGTPYHMNNDVFFISSEEKCYNNSMCSNRWILSPLGSFRNTSSRTNQERSHSTTSPLLIKYRDRSQSDALNCKTRCASSSSANRRSYVSQQPTHV